MNILFACDLDNTLIHSFKHKKENDICIEKINDKEQGFMSQKSILLLREVFNKVTFIPVTTRSVEQYKRINWIADIAPSYAVTTNGGILLNGIERDVLWANESKSYCQNLYNDMNMMKTLLLEQDRFIRCRMVDDMYLFAYCKDGIDPKKCVAEYQPLTNLKVISSGKKIYFFPKELNKGFALNRLIKKYSSDIVISAGDSQIDISMLAVADIAIVPNLNMAKQLSNKKIYIKDENDFSDFVLKTVLDITKELQR